MYSKKQSKSLFLYSACIKSVGPLKALYTFVALPDRPVHSGTNSWNHFSHAAITRKDYSLIFPPLSIARYALTQLSELGRREENENGQTSKG